MNDRASAVPPTHFLEPSQIASLEAPVPLEKTGAVAAVVESPQKPPPAPTHQKPPSKRGNLFGQVWDGVRGRLRFRKDPEEEKPAAATARRKPDADERPTREDVMANYHQLVASGFFTSHAIQSSRQPGPPQRHPPPPPPHGAHPATAAEPPQWPLAPHRAPPPPPEPAAVRPSSPVLRSPASASSRGTKRAAAPASADDDDDDDALTPRKLRKSASRDIALPKLRSIASRRAILGRRSFSTAGTAPTADSTPRGSVDAPRPREPNKLTKRGPRLQVPERGASARRNVSEGSRVPGATRVLRPRKSAEPLSVKPDSNRGIPSVPQVPVKFTYGEDRENEGPWRGLRR